MTAQLIRFRKPDLDKAGFMLEMAMYSADEYLHKIPVEFYECAFAIRGAVSLALFKMNDQVPQVELIESAVSNAIAFTTHLRSRAPAGLTDDDYEMLLAPLRLASEAMEGRP